MPPKPIKRRRANADSCLAELTDDIKQHHVAERMLLRKLVDQVDAMALALDRIYKIQAKLYHQQVAAAEASAGSVHPDPRIDPGFAKGREGGPRRANSSSRWYPPLPEGDVKK